MIFINTIRGFANPAFNFLIMIFGIQFFGKEDWATLINALLWVFFITFSFGWGNREYLIRAYTKQPGKIYKLFYSNFFSRSLLLPLSLLLLLFFPISIAIWGILLVALMHSYNALDSLVVFHQKFEAQFIAEIISFCIIFGSIFYFDSFSLTAFLKIYCLGFFSKTLFILIILKIWKEKISFYLSIQEFKNGFPFFILGFSGWLMSKIDLYIVDFSLPKAMLSEYQLFITAFIMLQAISGFMLIPFTKHIYRLTNPVIKKIKSKLYISAIPLVVVGTFGIWIIMEKIVLLNFSYKYYVLGALIALPSFFYTVNVMQLIKKHQEKKIIMINTIALMINLIVVLFLCKIYQLFGVLMGVCITQWVVFILYKSDYIKSSLK